MQSVQPTTGRHVRWFAAMLVWGCVFSALASADELYQTAARLKTRNAAELEELAAWCDQRGMTEQAQKTRSVLGPRDPYKLYLPVLPATAGRVKLPADSPPDVLQWDDRITLLRRDQANALYDLARTAVRHRPSLAYELVLEAVRVNPDHEAVRRLLGYQEYRGRWHTLHEVRQLRAGKVWHEKFGWLPKSHVLRYEQGLRLSGGRWISAEQDARLHHNIESGWEVNTEHYRIVTNRGLESGIELGAKLERLYRIWRQIFIRYYASEAQVVAMFDGRARSYRPRMPQFHVVYFRDRDDYIRSLQPAVPNIGMSIGLYLERIGRAYFFAGEEYQDRTYHEATHQLFHQSRQVAPQVGQKANYWIVEGIAMYLESLRREGDYDVLGGFDDQRLYAARYRLLNDNFYVSLSQLTTYGMEKIQADKRIATLYSQAAGLTNFLIYYDGGRYRDALVAYLSTVYSGRDDPGTLSALTGTSYGELDKQYRRFMQQSLQKVEADGP